MTSILMSIIGHIRAYNYKRIGVCNYLWRLNNIFVAFIERQQLKGILFFRAYITREVRNNNLTLYLRCTTTTLITHLIHTGIIHAYVHLCDNALDVSYVVFHIRQGFYFQQAGVLNYLPGHL